MKKCFLVVLILVLLIGCGCAAASVELTSLHFPDEKFLDYCATNFDTNGDNILSDAEIGEIIKIDISGKGIGNVVGIEYFTELQELKCTGCGLSMLWLGQNTKLEKLECGKDWINYPYYEVNIENLDLSKNKALKEVACSYSGIRNLNISGLTNLETLKCNGNKLSSIDLSTNTGLKKLYLQNDTDYKISLKTPANLTLLDASGHCLKELDISGSPYLTYVCVDLNPDVSKLDISNNALLETLKIANCNINHALDVSHCKNLWYLDCQYNQIPEIKVNSAMRRLSCQGNLITRLDISSSFGLCKVYNEPQDKKEHENLATFMSYYGEYAVDSTGFEYQCSLDVNSDVNVTAKYKETEDPSTETEDDSKKDETADKLSKPSSVKAVSNDYQSVKVSWSSVQGARQYKATAYSDKNCTKAYKSATTSGTSVIIKGLTCNTTYYVRVVAISGKTESDPSTKVKCKPVLPKVNLTAKAASSQKVTLNWKKVKGANGYIVQRSSKASSGFKTVKTIQKGTTKKVTLTSQGKGKVWYYRVAAYRMIGGKMVIGPYHTAVKVKIK